MSGAGLFCNPALPIPEVEILGEVFRVSLESLESLGWEREIYIEGQARVLFRLPRPTIAAAAAAAITIKHLLHAESS